MSHAAAPSHETDRRGVFHTQSPKSLLALKPSASPQTLRPSRDNGIQSCKYQVINIPVVIFKLLNDNLERPARRFDSYRPEATIHDMCALSSHEDVGQDSLREGGQYYDGGPARYVDTHTSLFTHPYRYQAKGSSRSPSPAPHRSPFWTPTVHSLDAASRLDLVTSHARTTTDLPTAICFTTSLLAFT